MSLKKIVVVRSTWSELGGAEIFALNIIKELSKFQCELVLLTLPDQQWPLDKGIVQIHELGVSRGGRLFKLWKFNREVEKYIHNHPTDFIFSIDRVSSMTHYHGGGGTHRQFLRIKNSKSSLLAKFFRQMSLFHWYTLKLERMGLKNRKLKKVHCCSSMVKQHFQRDYSLSHAQCCIIPNGIAWRDMKGMFDNKENLAKELMARHHLPTQVQFLLFLGSGFERKGLAYAIRGLTAMSQNVHLLVIGKGRSGAFENLAREQQVFERIHFLGPQPDGKKYMCLARALVLLSSYEPFGLVCAEAQAMGLPVMISSQTGYSDILKSTGHGIIVDNIEDEVEICQASRKLEMWLSAPEVSPETIRESVSFLDHKQIMKKMVSDFFEL